MRGSPCASGVVVHQRARRRRSSARCCRDVDEVLGAAEPVVMARLRGTVAQQLLRHQQRGGRTGRCSAHRGGALAPGWVQGGSSLVLTVDAAVVAAAVAAVVLRVLDARLGIAL